jgi:Protein of unknown function (DUF3828)
MTANSGPNYPMKSLFHKLSSRHLYARSSVPICVFLVCAPIAYAQPAGGKPPEVVASSSQTTPQTTLVAFYHWYLDAFARQGNPLEDDRARMESYVTKGLLQEIDKRIQSPDGLDEDYFIRAQDYFNDWATDIVVSDVRINRGTASALVTLGRTRESRHRLKVTLVKEGRIWKISGVSQPTRKKA